MADVLLVAATEIELCERPGLACGIGPVEAAAATARAIATDPPAAVLHVGIAGGRGITPGGLVIGSESLYIDLSAEITIVDHVQPDPELLSRVCEAVPDALVLPIGTSGAVGGVTDDRLRVEAMEGFGVLRACELAGIPAVEIRAISNDLGEGDRSRWRIGRALGALDEALPGLLDAAAK
jgi:futalosine hydrolase